MEIRRTSPLFRHVSTANREVRRSVGSGDGQFSGCDLPALPAAYGGTTRTGIFCHRASDKIRSRTKHAVPLNATTQMRPLELFERFSRNTPAATHSNGTQGASSAQRPDCLRRDLQIGRDLLSRQQMFQGYGRSHGLEWMNFHAGIFPSSTLATCSPAGAERPGANRGHVEDRCQYSREAKRLSNRKPIHPARGARSESPEKNGISAVRPSASELCRIFSGL
jgi:hypothetical protein